MRNHGRGPGELINTVDDYVLNGFIEAFDSTFSEEQRTAILQFREAYELFCVVTPRPLEPSDVLADPGWDSLRRRAFEFVRAFVGVWPGPESRIQADELLEQSMRDYAARNTKAIGSISKTPSSPNSSVDCFSSG